MKKVIGFGLLFMLIIHLFGAMVFLGRNHGNSASVAQEAWTQGYMAGQQSVSGEEGAVERVAPPSYMNGMESHGRYGHSYGYEHGYGRHSMGHFSLFGMLLKCLIPFLLIGGLFAIFGKRCGFHKCGKGKSGRRCGPPWMWHQKHDENQEPRWVADDEDSEKSPDK